MGKYYWSKRNLYDPKGSQVLESEIEWIPDYNYDDEYDPSAKPVLTEHVPGIKDRIALCLNFCNGLSDDHMQDIIDMREEFK